MIAVDVGNTKTAMAFFREGVRAGSCTLGTQPTRTAYEYKTFLEECLASIGESFQSAGTMIVASVVPAITEEFQELKKEIDIHFVSHKSPLSFQIDVAQPETIGADRIANLEGATRKYGTPVIVLDVGTATTLSVINRQKCFVGGMIAPGLRISSEALFARAAALQPIELTPPTKSIGANTADEMQIGIVAGHAQMVDGLMEGVRKELGQPATPVIATGGGIQKVAPLLTTPVTLDPELTLDGLRLIHETLMQGGPHA